MLIKSISNLAPLLELSWVIAIVKAWSIYLLKPQNVLFFPTLKEPFKQQRNYFSKTIKLIAESLCQMPTKTQRNIIFFLFSNIIMGVTSVLQRARQFQGALKFPSGNGPSGVYYLLRCFPGIYQLPSGKFICYCTLFNFSSLLMCLCYCRVEFINCARRWQQWKPLCALHS